MPGVNSNFIHNILERYIHGIGKKILIFSKKDICQREDSGIIIILAIIIVLIN